jgi:hypothetical protein
LASGVRDYRELQSNVPGSHGDERKEYAAKGENGMRMSMRRQIKGEENARLES